MASQQQVIDFLTNNISLVLESRDLPAGCTPESIAHELIDETIGKKSNFCFVSFWLYIDNEITAHPAYIMPYPSLEASLNSFLKYKSSQASQAAMPVQPEIIEQSENTGEIIDRDFNNILFNTFSNSLSQTASDLRQQTELILKDCVNSKDKQAILNYVNELAEALKNPELTPKQRYEQFQNLSSKENLNNKLGHIEYSLFERFKNLLNNIKAKLISIITLGFVNQDTKVLERTANSVNSVVSALRKKTEPPSNSTRQGFYRLSI